MRFLLIFLLFAFFVGCDKVDTPPVVDEPADFILRVENDFNELQAHFTVVLSDEDGNLITSRDIPGNDSARIVLPGVGENARYDCTVFRSTIITAPGSGVKDTTVTLQTYPRLASGHTLEFRNLNYKRVTDLRIQFSNITTVDSILVPEAVTIARPLAANNYSGHYQVYHTGRFWLRVRINGEAKWRFMRFDNINTDEVDANVDATLLPIIFDNPPKIQLPYTTAWKYNLEGIYNLDNKELFPLGDFLRAPGGITPIFNQITAYEPESSDVFNPNPSPFNSYRLLLNGSGSSPENFHLQLDRIFTEVPANIEVPAFNAQLLPISSDRYAAVTCSGDFDLMALRFSKGVVTWEVYLPASNGAIVSYRLPDLPASVRAFTSTLQKYDFGKSILSRAESFENLNGYDAVVRRYLSNNDPLWRAKANYTAKGSF
jgi:hypothetical protein